MTLDIVVVAGDGPRYAPGGTAVAGGSQEGTGMSFIKRAQEAAAQAAENARLAMEAAGAGS
jgi:hypothetical protein